MKLHRPYIPLAVRVDVANRQCWALWSSDYKRGCGPMRVRGESLGAFLGRMLVHLFPPDGKAELHHRPALVNRERRKVKGRVVYRPDANDPSYLIYLAPVDHDIETRVRGVGAELSDLGKARKAKRVRKNRERGKGAAPVFDKRGRTIGKIPEKRGRTHWPSRPFPKKRRLV